MLNLLRNQKTQKRIYLVLAVAVIASFGVSGLLITQEDSKASSSIGKIRGRNITVQDYLASYKAVDHQARMMYGKAFDQVRSYINFKGEAWDRLLLLSHAKQQGIRASDQEVVQWIGQQPFLQTNGQFDDRIYKMFVKEYLRTDARRFEEEIRETITIAKIQDKLEPKTPVSDSELKELYDRENGERDIEYVVYSSPASEAAVSEEELKQLYSLYGDNLKEPAKVKIRYLLIPKEKETEFKDAAADSTSSLEALADKYKLTPVESPYFSKNEAVPGLGLVSEITDKSFSLSPKESSAWIPTPAGLCKIEVLDKKEPTTPSFEESKEKLKEILARQKANDVSMKKLTEISKDLKAADFAKFAQDQKLELRSMKQFKEGSYVAGIGPSSLIQKTLSQTQEGELAGPVAVPAGAALVKVVKISGADPKKFEEEKAEFTKKVQSEKSQIQMDKLLVDLRKELAPNLTLLKEIFPEEETKK